MPGSESEPTPSQPAPSLPAASTEVAPKPKPRRRILRRVGILLLAFLIFGAVGLGGAEYYTSKPEFCGTCHIMDPYYVSWSHDKHSGKPDVWCVECHYAPGEQHTIMAKFKGLSQLASYFSGRYGSARPRAHVSDSSCMRSSCHGDNVFLEKKIVIGELRTETRMVGDVSTDVERAPSVTFNHAVHLKVDDRLAKTDAAIAAMTKQLGERMNGAALAAVRKAATSVQSVSERKAAMTAKVLELGVPELTGDAMELMRLEHERLRFLQLESITCASCHSYDAGGKNHFAVDRQSCFVCHFTNQEFNQDTGSCLRCHEPPTRKIFVHGAPPVSASGPAATQASAGPLLDHRDIVERGINCESCHADVVRGKSTVSARECTHCHDQQRFIDGFEERTTSTVADYHRVHVAAQRARCPDCHKSVEHSLVNPLQIASSTDFLTPVLDDCQHCHPGHHKEQVQLLAGTGGHGVAHPMPNSMFGSRLNCRACHTESGSDFKGAPLIAASQAACAACHGDDYRQLFEQSLAELKTYVDEVQGLLTRVEADLQSARQAGRNIPEEAVRAIEQAKANLQFVRSGNGIHNKNYALQVLDVCRQDLDRASAALGGK